MKIIAKYVAGIMLVMWSAISQAAMTAWIVESGDDPFLNSQGVLELTAGTTSLDLYYGASGGDTIYGYDLILDITGTGSISNVAGGDLELDNAYGSGWHVIGGDYIDGEDGSSVLGFSFDFTADAGASLLVSGLYTDLNFLDASISSATLANVSAAEISPVPVPAAAWLFGSGLVGLIGFARRKA